MDTPLDSNSQAAPAPAPPASSRVRAAARGVLPVLLSAGLLSLLAGLFSAPFLAPPLGASIYVCFHNRGRKVARPRTLIVSHLVAILAARLSVVLVSGAPVAMAGPDSAPALLAVVLALSATVFVLDLLGCQHPAAGATTLVVTYGLLDGRGQLALLGGCVVLALAVSFYDRATQARRRPPE